VKIKPCPWCGKKVELWEKEDPYHPGGPVVEGYYIQCFDCWVEMYDDDVEKLIKRWNGYNNEPVFSTTRKTK